MRTETLTTVFTDIKGYTAATSAQTHQENAHMLRRTERLIAPVVRAYNGRVIKSIGDAYMIVFRSPTEAVRCATAVQDRLHQYNTNTRADQGIHIRIAINVGEVRVHRGDVFGEPVNIAARIEAVTPADEIYFAQAVYLTMNRSEIAIERVGDYEFKGIPELVTVYRVKRYAHIQAEEGQVVPPSEETQAAGLPFGGTQLDHWRKMRWLRRAYVTAWGLAVIGMLGAGYLRYRPRSDYSGVVAAAKAAFEHGRAMDVLAISGQIPPEATEERAQARRYRRGAVDILIGVQRYDTAASEIEALLREDGRDAEALLLRGLLRARSGGAVKDALDDVREALQLQPRLGERADVIDLVVRGYADPISRRSADAMVADVLGQRAVPELKRTLSDGGTERDARNAIAARLQRLGAGEDIDWVPLVIDDLHSTSCKVRKAAISKLVGAGDERAVGPLLKVAEGKGCGATQAAKAAESILKK